LKRFQSKVGETVKRQKGFQFLHAAEYLYTPWLHDKISGFHATHNLQKKNFLTKTTFFNILSKVQFLGIYRYVDRSEMSCAMAME